MRQAGLSPLPCTALLSPSDSGTAWGHLGETNVQSMPACQTPSSPKIPALVLIFTERGQNGYVPPTTTTRKASKIIKFQWGGCIFVKSRPFVVAASNDANQDPLLSSLGENIPETFHLCIEIFHWHSKGLHWQLISWLIRVNWL